MEDPVEGAAAEPKSEEMIPLSKAEALVVSKMAESRALWDKQAAETNKELVRLRAIEKASEMDADAREAVYGAEPLKRDAAAHLAAQYGIPQSLLEGIWPYSAMQAMAQQYQDSVQAGVKADLARLAAQKPAQPGAAQERLLGQTFGSPATGAINYAELLRSGKPMPPAAEIDRMTAQPRR